MDNQENKNPYRMDWEGFQDHFKNNNFTRFPNQDEWLKNFSWIEDYVQGILQSSIPNREARTKQAPTSKPHTELFDTHDFMIVKIKTLDGQQPSQVKAHLAVNQLKIEGFTTEPLHISLPEQGRAQGSKAYFKGDTLEIRIPKESNVAYNEIYVRYL